MVGKAKARVCVAAAVLLVLAWLAMFATDYHRCATLQRPEFVVPLGATADDGGSGTYVGLGYTVELEMSIDADGGLGVESVEMRLLGIAPIAASIT